MALLANGNGVIKDICDNGKKHRIPDLILKKRNGGTLTEDEIKYFIKAITNTDSNNNTIQPSQIGAMLMAIYYKSMTFDESFHFTKTMMDSGKRLSFPKWRNLVVDKHSTGGVGDKISLPLAPALAACGLKVPMISGRGLGWTGGTLDKLEAIPGYQVYLSPEVIDKTIDEVGCCIVGQTSELNPADRVLYATRDITSTVDCIPLIASSIVSKKAIEDLDALVLDIKIGKAAFMKRIEDAEQLANYMVEISKLLNIKAGAFMTINDNPLGKAIGNQIEIEETVECLHGNIPNDLLELITKFGGYLLYRINRCKTVDEGAKLILEKLRNGEALNRFKEMIIAQGVQKDVATELCDKRNYSGVFKKQAKYTTLIKSQKAGYINSIDALELGVIGCKLGAGREKAGDIISYEVGMELIKTIGDEIKANEPWLKVYHNTPNFSELYEDKLKQSLEVQDEKFEPKSLIFKIIDYM